EYVSLGQVPQPDYKGEPPKRETHWVPVQGELFPRMPDGPASTERVTDDKNTERELRTPQHWERLLVDAAVIGGRDRWTRRLDGLEREFEKQIEELQTEDEPRLARIERQRERLGQLRAFALPLIDFLNGLPKSALWGDWLDRLAELATMSLRE